MNAMNSATTTKIKQQSLTTVVLISAIRALLDAVAVCGGWEAGSVGAEEAVAMVSLWN